MLQHTLGCGGAGGEGGTGDEAVCTELAVRQVEKKKKKDELCEEGFPGNCQTG